MQTFFIVAGLVLIVITFLDFFHSTLSGNGFGFFSGNVNRLLNRIILLNKNRMIFEFSGLVHLLFTTAVWLGLLFLGTFLIFSSGEEMVISANSNLPATYIERFYYTGYVLSTLGIGDFVPGSNLSRIFAATLSFSGFVLITTGLTYLLSVVQAVLKKKKLSFYISTLGEDIEELYQYFKQEDNLDSLLSDASEFRGQILENASSYLAFPMVDYFLTKDRKSALIVQLARLYDVLVVLQKDWGKESIQYTKLQSIINAINKYLNLSLEKPRREHYNEEKLRTLRSYWRSFGYIYDEDKEIDRKFSSSLKYSGWNWDNVYRLKDFK